MVEENLLFIIESILFAFGDKVDLNKIAFSINKDENTTRNLIETLKNIYEKEKRGIKIIEINNSYQMCTNKDYFKYISKIYNTKQKRTLTEPLLETLAIIAYKQPITKLEIEEIRGINSNHVINKLIEYKLICEKGRKKTVGKPILFITTDEFLKYFNLKNISQLPKLEENIENFKKEAIEEVNKFI